MSSPLIPVVAAAIVAAVWPPPGHEVACSTPLHAGTAQTSSRRAPAGQDRALVPLEQLLPLLPRLEGWRMDEPVGERVAKPIPTTSVKARYGLGRARVQVQIVDSALNDIMVPLMEMVSRGGYEKQSASGSERGTVVSGQPAVEKWDGRTGHGELTVLVNKRILVTIDGDDLDGVQVLKAIAAQIDFARISRLK